MVRTRHLDLELSDGLTEISVDFAQGARLGGSVIGLRREEDAFVDVYMGALDEDQLTGDFPRKLVWQGPVQDDGTFQATGFEPGTYTIRVAIADESATTASERAATFAGVVVDLADDQADAWVEIVSH